MMRFIALWVAATLVSGAAQALEADHTLQQLNHKGWTLSDGAPGAIYAITQTTDGTLWVGGPNGLSRFDGIRFVRYDGTGGRTAVSTDVSALAAAPDGALWIGFALGGITVLRANGAATFGDRDGLPVGSVNRIMFDRDGVTYAATTRGLYELQANRWREVVLIANNPGARVVDATVDRAGTIWALTGARLWARPERATEFREIMRRDDERRFGGAAIASAPDGRLWALNLNRVGSIARIDAPAAAGDRAIPEMAITDLKANSGISVDRDGNLWVGGAAVRRYTAATLAGDLGVAAAGVDTFSPTDGLSGGSVNCFFEDREGNMWAGTYAGLDKFSRSNVVRVGASDTFGAVVAGDHGKVWVSALGSDEDTPYQILEIGNGAVVGKRPSPPFTSAYRAPDGSMWFAGREGIIRFDPAHATKPTPLPVRDAVQSMAQDQAGALWVAISRNSIYRFADGKWLQKGGIIELPNSSALAVAADAAGRIWLGYRNNRVVRLAGSIVTRLGEQEGLNVGNVTAIAVRQDVVWIGGDRGFGRYDGARFIPVTPDSGSPFTGISGIVAPANGDLWINGNAGIVHLPFAELERARLDPAHRVRVELFDRLDGLRGYARQVRPSPSAVEATDGKIWFATQLGLVAIDPARIARNPLPPPVTIWSLQGRSVQYPAVPRVELPIHTTNVRIAYGAASLTVPERVRFRYRLVGLDPEWQDAADRREAFYTNVGPGHYTFRVIASNNDGVWNETGASLEFMIAPAFYQTRWFIGLCVVLCLALLRLLYLMRIRQVSTQVRGRLEERLAERERIARELHDTLLQSVQGLVLRFRAAVVRLPPQEPARELLEQALDRADGVLAEGRDRVKDLRSTPGDDLDLARAITALGEELATDHTSHFRSTVEGSARDLHPIVREELMFIAREALTNAFLHAAARQVEVEITYGESELRIRIRDDGKGIDTEVLRAGGRAGHWGLLGMRERAEKIRATLTIWSKAGAGTELDVRLPANIAYQRRKAVSLPGIPAARQS